MEVVIGCLNGQRISFNLEQTQSAHTVELVPRDPVEGLGIVSAQLRFTDFGAYLDMFYNNPAYPARQRPMARGGGDI